MGLGEKVGGFFLSTLESFPELFGIEPSQSTQEFRAQAPVSGFASQAIGAFVPYLGAAKLARAAPLTRSFITAAEALGATRGPIASAALGLGAEAAVVEAGRVGLAATGAPAALYGAVTGREPETRGLGTLAGEAAFNVAGSAALGGVGGAIMDRLRRGAKIHDIIPGAAPDRPLVQQIRAMNEFLGEAKDPANPLNPDPVFIARVETDLANRIKMNLNDQMPKYTTDGMTIPSGEYRSQQGRLYRGIIGEQANRNGDGRTSGFLNRLSNWTSKSVDKLTETRRLVYSPEGRGAFGSPKTLDEIMAKIVPGLDRDTFGMYALDARVVRVRSGQGNQPKTNSINDPLFRFSENDKQVVISPTDQGLGGQNFAGLFARKDGNTWKVDLSGLPSFARGQGLGKRMYSELLRKAQERGAQVTSDFEVSTDAAKVWESFGAAVEKNPDAVLTDLVDRMTGKPRQAWMTADKSPIFTYTGTVARKGFTPDRLLSSEPKFSKVKNSAAQSKANGLESRFMHKSFADVGQGWRMARETDGLFVMAKKIEGEIGKPAPGDQWVFFRTDRPDVFASRAAKSNDVLMKSAYWPQAAEDDIILNEPLWDKSVELRKVYGEAPETKATKTRLGAVGTMGREAVDTASQIVTPSAPLSYRNPTLARGFRLIKDLEHEVETRVGKLMDGTRKFDDKKSLASSFIDLDAPKTNGLRDFIKTLTKSDLETVRFVLETETPYEVLSDLYKSGVKTTDGENLISEAVFNFFTGQQGISDQFVSRSKLLDGVLAQSSAVKLLGELQARKGHYALSREYPGAIKIFLQDEHGDIVGLMTGKSVTEAQAAAADTIAKQANRGKVLQVGGLVDETLLDADFAQRMRAAVIKPGFLKNRGDLLGDEIQRGELTTDRLAALVEKNLRRRENWLKDIVLKEHLAAPIAKLAREDVKSMQILQNLLERSSGDEGAFAKVQNAMMDKVLHAVGFSGKDTASSIVRTTQSLLNSFQMAFGNITQPLLNGIGMFQTIFPEIAFTLHASPEVLARYYVSVPMLNGNNEVSATMGILSEVKLMNNAFKRVGTQWSKQEPEFRQLIEDLIADRSLAPRYAEEQFGANGAILKDVTQGFKDTQSFIKLANSANEIMLSKTEEFNRLVSVSAAFDLAKLKGLNAAQTKIFAREFLAKTAFNYGSVDRAKIFTTPLGSLMGTFKNWSFHYMANMVRYSTEGKSALPALFWQTAATGVVGGAVATPLILPVADAFSKWATDRTAMENVYAAVGSDGEWAADGLMYGLPGALGLSFASQAASPGSDPERDAQMIFSFAAMDRIKSLSRATKDAMTAYSITGESPWEDENVRREMIRALAPRTIYRAMAVAENTAVTSMATGYDVTQPMGLGGALLYGAGFNPRELEKTYEGYNLIRDSQEKKRAMVMEYGQTLAQAWENGDTRLANRVFVRAMATGIDTSAVLRSAKARTERGQVTQLEFAASPEDQARLPWLF